MRNDALESIAHVIQIALTPVFLLSGIATLLTTLNTRLARVSDHTEHVADLLKGNPEDAEASRCRRHLARLLKRRITLDVSVFSGAFGAASTCAAVFVLFLGSLQERVVAAWLFSLFGFALFCTIGALAAFLVDTVLAWHGLRYHGPLPHIAAAPRQ